MAELTTQERLQPSLLDRLTDDEPGVTEESRNKRVITAYRLRDCVSRDLSWLLNCVNLETSQNLEAFPQVRNSVINYGIPDLTGVEVAGLRAGTLQNQIRNAVIAFEPRLTAHTLNVIASVDATNMSRKSLQFRIESEMWAQPIPQNLYLKTEVDLETGHIKLTDSQG